MEYSAHFHCCRQTTNIDFDEEHGRCFMCQERWRTKRDKERKKARKGQNKQATRQMKNQKSARQCGISKFTVRRATVI